MQRYQEYAERFVRCWQSASSLEEAAEKMGISMQAAWMTAFRYRKKGVPLKAFGRVKSPDYARLAKLATEAKGV